MHKKILILIGVLQLMFFAYLIVDSQMILDKGEEFKFETALVDPYDIFRGHYVTLKFRQEEYNKEVIKNFTCTSKTQKLYAEIIKDKNGFAQIQSLNSGRPKNSTNYFVVKINNCLSPWYLSFPFYKFFLGEKLAQKAEKDYIKYSKKNKTTYALVKLYKGKAIIKNLYLNNQPLLPTKIVHKLK